MRTAAFLVIAMLWPLAAMAQTYEDALAAYVSGDFAGAAAAARALDSADGWALAARAELVVAAYREPDRGAALASLDRAISDARRAVELDPGHIEGRLQLAIGIGYQARIHQSPSLARDARRLVDAVLADAPDNGYALAVLGGWHGETVATLGGFMARLMVGARTSEFTAAFDRALEADPANPATPAYYARLLLDIGGRDFRERAAEVLALALATPPRDAFEAMMVDQARALDAALASGDKNRLKDLIRRQTPFR